MKKCSKWILGILLVVSVFTFAGCKDDKKDSDGKIVLTVWERTNKWKKTTTHLLAQRF